MTTLTVALLGLAAAAIGSLGHRFQVLPFGPAFALLGVGFLALIVSIVMAVVRLVMMVARHQPERMGLVIGGLIIALIILAIPASLVISNSRSSQGLPAIHDITTDTTDPPAFVDVLPLRADAPNTATYGGAATANQQRKAYPDVVPAVLPLPPDQAFDRALEAVRELKWDVAGSNRAQGRIEATDTTFWFGFKDDVVIRVRPADGGSRVDVRSLSRVGGGDVGTNAKRIRTYLMRLKSGT